MQDLLRYSEREFKGYNDTKKPENLTAGYAALILNGVVEDNKITKRNGYTIIGNDLGSMPNLGLTALEPDGGTKKIVAVFNDGTDTNSRMLEWTGAGSWSEVIGATSFTPSLTMRFSQAANKIYGMNGTDTVKSYDGTTASDVVAYPLSKRGIWFHNYMFCAGNTSYPHRIYFSNVDDPETWGGADYIDINPGDGDEITGLSVLGEELVISKKNTVWSLTGFDVGSFTINDVNGRIHGYGSVAGDSFGNIGNDNLFLSFVGTTPHLRSLRRTRYAVNVAGGTISEAVESTLNGLNKSSLEKSTSIFDGRRYYLSLPDGASSHNDTVLVYDTAEKAFVKWTGMNVAHWCVSTIGGKAEIYFGEASADGKVYKLDTSDSDNGAAIDFQYKTRAYICRGERGTPKADTKAKWKYLFITADSGSDVNLDIDSSPDTYTFEDEAVINLIGSSSVLPFSLPQPLGVPSSVRERVNIGRNPSHMLQFLFSQKEADKPVTIREYSVLFKPKRLRDA